MNKKTVAAAAILLCAVMVLVAGAPLVVADTHHIVKGAQGPRASAVSWEMTAPDDGFWHGHIVNAGLRSLVVDVNDVTGGTPTSILHQRIRFAAYPTSTLDTKTALMMKDRVYNITATPNGVRGSYCDVEDVFVPMEPPVAMFSYVVNGPTVAVDGSTSYDPDGTVTGWAWDFGDGMTGSGVTTTHTYATTGDYTINLTVIDNTGMTGSVQHIVHVDVIDTAPVASFKAIVSGYSVSVDASGSSDDVGIVSYDWQWGDGMTGSGVTATHTYVAPGPYVITLTVTDTIGQTGTATMDITVVDLPPVASFTLTMSGLTVSVDASASFDDVAIVSYDWAWGDGMTGTGVTATHTYAGPSTYEVTLTVTDTIGQTGTMSAPAIAVDNAPLASFTATMSGYTVSVDASASSDDIGITSYAWDFGDGATASGVTATHTYAGAGQYTITLTVTDTIGQTGTATKTVNTFDSPPVAAFTFVVSGYTVSVDAVSSSDDNGIVSYAWQWGDGATGTGVTAVHAYNAPPLTYTITLTVTDTIGQTNSVSHSVTLQDNAPTAAFTWTVTGYVVNVDGSGSTDDHGVASYSWNWGDGSAAGSGVTATHTYTGLPLTRTVTLTVTDTVGQTNSVSHIVDLVDNGPTAAFTSSMSGYTVSVDASASSDDLGITSYAWAWGDGMTGTGMITTHTYAAFGTYTVTLTVTDTIGQTASVSHDVTTLDNKPVASFTATATGWVLSVDASASSDDRGIVSYDWTFGDGGTGTGITTTHIYSASNTYTVTLTVTDTIGQTGSESKSVIILDNPPTAAFTISLVGYTVSVDASSSSDDFGITSYAWNWGDSNVGSGKTATHTYSAPGTYSITLTVTDTVGQTNMLSKPVQIVDNPPVAAFTPTVAGLDVSVDASASSDDFGITSYAWAWGDGATGSGVTATHTYASPGTKTITLTVTDTIGQTNAVSHDVTLSGGTPPVAAFTFTVSPSTTVNVDGSSSTSSVGIAKYDWNFGDWITATGVTHSHYYVAKATWTVTLTVTDINGLTNSVSQLVTAGSTNPPPFPYLVYGTTYASDGATPLPGTTIAITDVRTGETLIGSASSGLTVSDADGLYSVDISTLVVTTGDNLIAMGVGPSAQTGTGTGTVDLGIPYLGINVILT